MSLQSHIKQYKTLKQNQKNEFKEIMNAKELKETIKIELLEAFSERELTQDELTYISHSLISSMYSEQPYCPDSMCVCGTGGDKSNSFNISTTVSYGLASAGVPVIKHGNKSVTSSSGSTDLLNEKNIETRSVRETEGQLKDVGVVLLNATETYPIMKNIQPLRKAISNPTIFNITGPLINPFKLDYQVMGVYEPSNLSKIAQTLAD